MACCEGLALPQETLRWRSHGSRHPQLRMITAGMAGVEQHVGVPHWMSALMQKGRMPPKR